MAILLWVILSSKVPVLGICFTAVQGSSAHLDLIQVTIHCILSAKFCNIVFVGSSLCGYKLISKEWQFAKLLQADFCMVIETRFVCLYFCFSRALNPKQRPAAGTGQMIRRLDEPVHNPLAHMLAKDAKAFDWPQLEDTSQSHLLTNLSEAISP